MKTDPSWHNYPDLTMGTRVDGSPMVISARFRAGVSIANGTIYISSLDRSYDSHAAKELSRGLQEAADWLDGGLTLAVEKFHAQRLAEGSERASGAWPS